ncbi:MAG: hypothetical protein IJY42_01900 [Clostridia bacterium]|nr:hypothetical protein [Clostridia bacterium]
MPSYDLQRYTLSREGMPCLTVRISLPFLPDCPKGEEFYRTLGEACLRFCREQLLFSPLLERDNGGRQPTLRYSFSVRVTYEDEERLALLLHTALRNGQSGKLLAEAIDGHVMERRSGCLLPPKQAVALLGAERVKHLRVDGVSVENGVLYGLREGRRMRLCSLKEKGETCEEKRKKEKKTPCKRKKNVV